MKRFLITLALMCAFSCAVLAGDMPTGGIAQPPPIGTADTTKAGETQTPPGEIPTSGAPERLSSDALSAVLSVLGFLAV